MRLLLVIFLGLVAVGAAGVWALGEYGGAFTSAQMEARPPLVIEPEILAASDAPTAPAAANDAPALRSEPAPPPGPADAIATPDASAVAPEASGEPRAVAPPGPVLAERLEAPLARSVAPPAAPATEVPPPPATSADATITAQAEPVAPATTSASGLQSQFKSRKVTYNRPPAKLALDRAIDVSLVINATEDEEAGRQALQGFPGEVVERDVELSDTVSAQLTGIGFDIETQTVERQKLSGRAINRWQWRVTPTETGTRTLILEIFGYESGSLDAEPLAAYRDEIVVEVQQLDQIIGWAKSVQPIFAVLAGLAAVGSALFAFLRFREEKKRGKVS